MDFNQPHQYEMGDNSLHTYSFNLNGNYTDILKVVHTIEQKGNFGEVVHIDFQKKKNYRTNRYNLGATVFVQQVKWLFIIKSFKAYHLYLNEIKKYNLQKKV